MSETAGDVTGPEHPSTWHVLDNDLVVVEGWDADAGRRAFHQLQGRRRLEPEDLHGYEKRLEERLQRLGSHWGLVAAVGSKLLVLAVVAIPAGLIMAQLDATESVGSWLFWAGIPVAVVLYVVLRIGVWRMERTLRRIQQEAGLVPGMITEIDQREAARLIETHGTRFTVQQASA